MQGAIWRSSDWEIPAISNVTLTCANIFQTKHATNHVRLCVLKYCFPSLLFSLPSVFAAQMGWSKLCDYVRYFIIKVMKSYPPPSSAAFHPNRDFAAHHLLDCLSLSDSSLPALTPTESLTNLSFMSSCLDLYLVRNTLMWVNWELTSFWHFLCLACGFFV